MRHLLTICLFIVTASLFCGEEPQETLADVSTSAQRALVKYREDCQKARREYLEKIQKAQTDFLRVLDREIDRTTKRGELDEALALRERVRKLLQEEAIWTDSQGNPIEPLNLGVEEEEGVEEKYRKALVGRTIVYTMRSGGERTYILSEDGTVNGWNIPGHTAVTWEVVETTENGIVLIFKHGDPHCPGCRASHITKLFEHHVYIDEKSKVWEAVIVHDFSPRFNGTKGSLTLQEK